MFTIKWIVATPHGEVTRLFEARDVRVAYRNSNPGIEPDWGHLPRFELADRPVKRALLVIDPGPNFAGHSFDCGKVYVMNETGATVAKYVLSDAMIDIAEPPAVPPLYPPIAA